jgi:hypothetical protein
MSQEKTRADEILEEVKNHGKKIEQLGETLKAMQEKPKGGENKEVPTFGEFIDNHVVNCPDCQKELIERKDKILKIFGMETPKTETPKENEKWGVSGLWPKKSKEK